MDFEVNPSEKLHGEWVVPGDKSISHRALLFGAIAQGHTEIDGFLFGEDCLATLRALQELGVSFTTRAEKITVEGNGLYGLKVPFQSLDCGNSGTTMRLLAGLLAPQSFSSQLTGDQSLSKRPMKRIVAPLRKMGALITGQEDYIEITAPLLIEGGQKLQGIDYVLPIASAQIKSCLLLAGLYASSPITLTEKVKTRDHTERLLAAFGAKLSVKDNTITLSPSALYAQNVSVPGDLSSAAFFIAGASMTKGSHILLRHVGVNPTRMGIIHILKAMGADITLHDVRLQSAEPVADIEVKGADLKGITLPNEWVTSAMDEFPIIFVVASLAHGETRIEGIKELRFKETDRISTMAQGLRTLGVALEESHDGIVIQGGEIKGGVVSSEGDHRVAMAFAMASLKAKDPIHIKDCENINTSFPGFVDFANQCGLTIKAVQNENE